MCSKSVLLDFHLKQDTHGQILSCNTGPCPHWFWWSSFAVAGHCDLPRHSRASCTPRYTGANHDSCTAKQDSGTSLQPSLCGNMPIQPPEFHKLQTLSRSSWTKDYTDTLRRVYRFTFSILLKADNCLPDSCTDQQIIRKIRAELSKWSSNLFQYLG